MVLPQPAQLQSPPRARLTFRVGIVGHRPNRLPTEEQDLASLSTVVRAILSETRAAVLRAAAEAPELSLYAPQAPVLRAVSPLAEGADRLLAENAIELGYELCCPMPFAQNEFENDFRLPAALEADSLARFRSLLQRAKEGAGLTTFELDGERARAEEAYGAAGRVVLNQSDLLVAIWDGGKPAGGGGTVHTLSEALQHRVPVIWIDALAPHAWQLMEESDLERLNSDTRASSPAASLAQSRSTLAAAIRQIVDEELKLPRSSIGEKSATSSHAYEYFTEAKPRRNRAWLWKFFRDAVGTGKLRLPHIAVADFEAAGGDEWAVAQGLTSAALWPHFAWSDKLADLYADKYRSGYLASYLLSALAVFLALLPLAARRSSGEAAVYVAVEFLVLSAILVLLMLGRKNHWHDRWMEYRLLAELIRQLRFLIPLGGVRPLLRVPAHLAVYGDPTQTWMYWHVRAIARDAGLPEAKIARNYIADYLEFLGAAAGSRTSGQWKFHLLNESRSNAIARRLYAASFGLFIVTWLGIALHFVLLQVFAREFYWLVLTSATLPALGAALAGINNQGEFRRIAKRSAAMASGFEKFAARIAALRARAAEGVSPPKLPELIPLASKIAEVMVEEVVDWRAVFIDEARTV